MIIFEPTLIIYPRFIRCGFSFTFNRTCGHISLFNSFSDPFQAVKETHNLRSIQSGFIFLETCECSCSAQAFSWSGRRQKPHFITLEPPTSQFNQRTIHSIILSFSMIFSISKNVKTATKKELLIFLPFYEWTQCQNHTFKTAGF